MVAQDRGRSQDTRVGSIGDALGKRQHRYNGAMQEERTLLEDAVDVPLWLETDRDLPLAKRADRDRDIARRCQARDDLERVRSWWSSMRPGPGLGAAVERGRRLISVGLVVVGIVAGGGVAAAALRYDGREPVNIVRALALLVGLQLLVLLLTLMLLPSGRFGLGAVQRSIVSFNPAAIAAAVYRRFAALPEALERLFVWHNGRSSANRFAKWQLLFWAQLAAIGFNIGVLVTSFSLVAATDLAFGWSTTLDLQPRDVAAATDTLSAPWAAWLPQAVPSAELIEHSRFFRLEHVATPAREAEAFTGWWPFLLVSIIAYGLLPRLTLWIFAATRLRRATRDLLLEDARVTALLDRMQSPSFDLAADAPEPAGEPRATGLVPAAAAGAGLVAAVIWAEAVAVDAAAGAVGRLLGARLVAPPLQAGGAATLADDRATLERIAALEPRQIALLTRAYEPPLLDLLDFVRALRDRVGRAVSIVVCPLPEGGGTVMPEEVEAWRRMLATLRDPAVYVETAA
jgi:hypothetical protein